MLATPELLQESAQPKRLVAEISRYVKQVPLYHDRPLDAADDLAGVLRQFGRWPLITKQDITH